MGKRRWVYLESDIASRPKHREMGEAIWLYLYMRDHVDWESGMINGWKDQEAADAMEMPVKTLRTHRRRLEEAGYISSVRGQYGQSIIIHNWTNPRLIAEEKIHPSPAPKGKTQSAQNRPLCGVSRVPKVGHSDTFQSAQNRPPIIHVDLNTSIHDHDINLSHGAGNGAATPPERNSDVKKNRSRSIPPDELYRALEEVCRMPKRELRTDAQKFQLDQTWSMLKKADVTAVEVRVVGEFYYTVKLAGKAGNPIRPHEVRENLEAARIWKLEQSERQPQTDLRWRDHYERQLRKLLKAIDATDARVPVIEEVLAQLPSISRIEDFRPLNERLQEADINVT